ncbi:MAG: hypothetical protein KDD29_01170 [Flavobacteriales bacterium]|nr:hypothetical protein [Flavobacteriales bacterium]
MIVDTAFTDMNGNFSIPLAFDQIYTIIIESPQFDTKWIVLSTILPEKMRAKDHTFRCEIEINPKTMSALKELANKEQ